MNHPTYEPLDPGDTLEWNGHEVVMLPAGRQTAERLSRCTDCEANPGRGETGLCSRSRCGYGGLYHWIRTDHPDFAVRLAEWRLTK